MKFFWPAAFLLTLALACLADTVVLKDGRSYEGVVLEETETSVKIKTAKATLTFQRDQVASVAYAAGGALQEREKKLAALDPSRPADYLAVANWLVGKGKDAYDLPTMRRLCALASKLDPALAFDAQMLMGKTAEAAGNRREAANCYARAKLSKPGNPEARVKLDDLRQGLLDDAKVEMEQLRVAIDLVTQEKYEEALPKLQKASTLATAERAPEVMGMSVEALTKDVARRVKCRTCDGTGETTCPACSGKMVLTCNVCDGTGTKKGFTAGKGESGFSDSVCRTCYGLGGLLCTKCKAERDIFIYCAYGGSRVKVHATAGHEADALKTQIDLVKYTRSGAFVASIQGDAPNVGGKTPCGTCQGVKYAPPPTPLPVDRVRLFLKEVEDTLHGQKPYDVVPAVQEVYDPAVLADGCVRYREGKWLK